MNKKDRKKSLVVSVFIAIFIIMMSILSGSAVTVSISGLSGSITQGTSQTFTVTATLENLDKFVPVSNVTLNISGPTTKQWTFNPVSGAIISPTGDTNISINVISSPNQSNFGYGSGYGVDNGTGYDFGNVSGYGYNYGQGGGNVSFIYEVTLSTASLALGDYTAIAYLNTESSTKPYFASPSVSFTISAASSGTSSGGGGGGGAGVTTSEPFANIEKSERYDKNLIANTPVTYSFSAAEHGLSEVIITGKENENWIAVRIEALKGASKNIGTPAPGTVYKNLNIIVGTKKIKEAIIKFKVENSWLNSNNLEGSDIRLMRWDGSKWEQLETAVISKDATSTYYEAKTYAFSYFTITGLNGVTVPTATPEVMKAPEIIPAETPGIKATPAELPIISVWMYYLIIAIVIIAVMYFLVIKKRGK